MSYITPEQFKKHFSVSGKTLAVTPSASLCARSLGHHVEYLSKDFDYAKWSYDTVLVDIVEGMKFDGYKARYQFAWLKTAVEYARTGAHLYVKGPSNILNQVLRLSYKVFVNKIVMDDGDAYLDIIREKPDNRKTHVKYDTDDEIDFDISKSLLPHKYNQQHIDYVSLVDSSVEKDLFYDRICVGGKQRNLFSDLYQESKDKGTYGLLIQNNCKKLQVSKLEDQSCNSSADIYFFKSEEVRDKYYDIFHQRAIINLAHNLACGGEMNKKVQSYLINPLIFKYAISN